MINLFLLLFLESFYKTSIFHFFFFSLLNLFTFIKNFLYNTELLFQSSFLLVNKLIKLIELEEKIFFNLFKFFKTFLLILYFILIYLSKLLIYCNFYMILLILPLLISVAYLTLVERKVIGASQRRFGPNVVGIFGVGQPLADGLKLFFKETILPTHSNKFIFFFSPIIVFLCSLLNWFVIPLKYGCVIADVELGVLYFLAISSLSVYGIVLAGWSSNSKYAFLGALRSTAQMISYEVSIGLILLATLLPVGSLNLTYIVFFQEDLWLIFSQWVLFLLFFVSSLAETNRAPFDLPEAEAELVSGYNVEYSSMGFALFFLAEYANIIAMSVIITIVFLGGWLTIFSIPFSIIFIAKILFILILFIWVRTTFPRFRYDQLMRLGWKVFLPLSLFFFLLSLVLVSFSFFI